MSENDNIIVDMSTRIFQDLCDPQTINSAQNDAWKEPLWSALEEAGLTAGFVSEELGGAGIEISDAFEILRVAGKFAVPTPLAETMLAGWLLSQGEIGFPGGRLSVAPVREKDRLSIDNNNTLTGTARSVPFAREADSFAVVARRGDEVVIALVDAASCQIANGLSLADDAKDEVTLDGVVASEVGRAPDEFNEDALFMMGALARSCEMAGALEAMLEISVTYSQDRVAFERPISKFQAVQHNLARLAGEAAAAVCAAGSAADALQRSGSFDEDVFFEIASAKIRVGEAAGEGAGIAHQVHGAIGFTMEHILHRYSRRVWSWRDEFGSESIWAVRLGEAVAAKGSDALWATLASR
ncbi:MAG: acyl-CoA dehydrogenase family protein [Pseudomonadota bacterium]|nr:acyl-CoA dehydrogenase family protein [Pseudomonadota bacterium]MEC7646781.1 acyl-CoA dehydrogenase family protein [Pseudomonadota bacterium]